MTRFPAGVKLVIHGVHRPSGCFPFVGDQRLQSELLFEASEVDSRSRCSCSIIVMFHAAASSGESCLFYVELHICSCMELRIEFGVLTPTDEFTRFLTIRLLHLITSGSLSQREAQQNVTRENTGS
ncbi:hypothetical protein F2P81_014408 [Scophthalmus maximus]|uniref:Uncharacterized protein n=1 Tax=Scophthalmus maximus TaxID=52904 RepID=A0A6A4SWA1_SCOMX|nr:hypothetical protein F2P81_014408 [Scophthalmus maximus]